MVACDEETTTEWEQFNASDDSVTIAVGDEAVLPMVTTTLHSSTGEVDIGSASVDPGGGPVGTTHVVLVELSSDYSDSIGRVSVRTSSPDHGEDEYDLDADSTGEGIYKLEVVSVGESGEKRDDTLTFRVWTEVQDTGDAG